MANEIHTYEYEFNCFSCGYNLIERNHELTKIQRRKINFINRLKYAKQKVFCICLDVYNIYEGNESNKINEVLSTLKNKKLKINNVLIKKYKDMLKVVVSNKIIGQKQQQVYIKLDTIVLD